MHNVPCKNLRNWSWKVVWGIFFSHTSIKITLSCHACQNRMGIQTYREYFKSFSYMLKPNQYRMGCQRKLLKSIDFIHTAKLLVRNIINHHLSYTSALQTKARYFLIICCLHWLLTGLLSQMPLPCFKHIHETSWEHLQALICPFFYRKKLRT